MKTLFFSFVLVAIATATADPAPTVITEWNFNDPSSLSASVGTGTLRALGGVAVTNLLGTASDPAKPNGAISLKGFPAQGQTARSAGVELSANVAGWHAFGLRFDVRASATANRHIQVLAAANGSDWVDVGAFDIPRDGVFTNAAFALSDPSFKGATELTVRLVSDFADGLEYVGVKPKPDLSNSYSSAGTWRFDLIAITGIRGGGDTAQPDLALKVTLGEQSLDLAWPEQPSGTFTVWRATTPAGPWTAVETERVEPSYSEPLEPEPQFFRVTSP